MTPISDHEKQLLLSQILESPEFHESKRYQEILQYLIEKSSSGSSLKEFEIARDLFGKGTDRRAFFPFAFLLLAVPVPMAVLEKVIAALVAGSTSMTRVFFQAFGVPFFQERAVFYLPGFSIEVARECSGIRSSLALLVTTILAGHIFLRRFRGQALLAVAVFPVAILKNAVRILTLYLLSYFVDIGIIQGGFLHRFGGFIFFGMGMAVLGLFLWFLREQEQHR